MQKIKYIGLQRKPIILKYIYQMLKKIVIFCGLFPTFLVEGHAKFQLEVNENKHVILSPSKFSDPLKSIHGPQVKNPCSIVMVPARTMGSPTSGGWENFCVVVNMCLSQICF
jgi:hypothetical protein